MYTSQNRTIPELGPIKTFDEWVKARTAKCHMALKDALSFISEKRSALDGEKDSPEARPAPPVRSNPSTQRQAAGGPTAPVTPSHPVRPPQTEERLPWSTEEDSSPWNPSECPPCSQGRGKNFQDH